MLGGDGSDVYAFNRGDGNDSITDAEGDPADIDMLSFGKDILPADVSGYVNENGELVLLIANSTDSLAIPWFDPATGQPEAENRRIERAQFLDDPDNPRTFDLAGIVGALSAELLAADAANPIPLFTQATAGFELSGLPIAGGDFALAYAQTGDLFAVPTRQSGGDGTDTITGGAGDDIIDAGGGNNLIDAGDGNNTVTTGDGDDRITTGSGVDIIFAGGGQNIIIAGAGNDQITVSNGNDVIDAGDGDDTIVFDPFTATGGGGNPPSVSTTFGRSSRARGGKGKDTYVYNPSDPSVPSGASGVKITIEDNGGLLIFGPGGSSDGLVVGFGGSLVITVLGTGDEIHLMNFDPDNSWASGAMTPSLRGRATTPSRAGRATMRSSVVPETIPMSSTWATGRMS